MKVELLESLTQSGSWEYDIPSQTLLWSEGVYKMLGYLPYEFEVNRDTIKQYIHPEDWENVASGVYQTVEKGAEFLLAFRMLHKSGKYIYVKSKGLFQKNNCGEPIKIIGVFQNVTDYLEAQQDTQRILDSSLDVICTITASGIFSRVSAASKDIWGYFPHEMEGKAFIEFVAEPDIEPTQKVATEILQGREFTNFENRYKHKSGHWVPVVWSAYWDAEQQIMHCVAKDGTEKKKAEETLLHSEKRYRALVENGADAIAILALDGSTSYVSPSIEKVLGYNEAEALKLNLFTIVHPDDRAGVQGKIMELLSKPGASINGDTARVKHKNGDWRWMEATITNMLHDPIINGIVDNFRDVTEQKELKDLLNKITEVSKIGGWEINMQAQENPPIFCSPMTCAILETEEGYSPRFNNGFEIFSEADEVLVKEAVDNLIKTGERYDLELLINTKKGNYKWVKVIGEAIFVDGVCIKLIGSIQDIHARKIIELDYKKLSEEKNDILESIGDAFFSLDKDWNVLYWNKKAEEIIGIKREKLLGNCLWDKIPESKNLKFFMAYEEAFRQQKPVHFEEFFPPLKQWYEASAYPNSEGISGFFRNITEKKITAEKIRRSNERFEKVAEATQDAIYDWDIVKAAMYFGRGFKMLFGLTNTQLLATFEGWISHIHPEDLEETTKLINDVLKDPAKTYYTKEYRFRKLNGQYAYVIDRGVIMRDESGKAIRMIGAISDISFRKEAEAALIAFNESLEKRTKELQQSNEELEQFAFIASHDLQEPLRMISSFLSQLERKYKSKLDDTALKYIEFAAGGAQRMRQIILDLLNFSKAGKFDVVKEQVDLVEIIQEYKQLRRRIIQEKNATITLQGKFSPIAYKTPLIQVIHNLLDNSLKYSNSAPQVVITITDHADHWLFSIEDNGIGIPESSFDKIFVMFQRLHNRDQYTGTGMGLAIVKKQVMAMNGTIWLTSVVNSGTTFYFTLPK